MWKMRWKARLRRYHDPGEMLLRTAATIGMVSIREGLDKAIGKKAARLPERQIQYSRRAYRQPVEHVVELDLHQERPHRLVRRTHPGYLVAHEAAR